MELTGRAGQHRRRARAVSPAARKAEQSPSKDIARKVLLRNGYLAARPTLAELAQVGKQDISQDGLRRERREQAVEGSVSGRFVEAIEGLPQLVRESGKSSRRHGLVVERLREGQTRRLRGGHPCAEMATHRADALLVGGRVEPKAALRAEGLEQAVALFPRAEQLRRDADPFAQRTDAQIRPFHPRTLYEPCTKI